jgi:hypothetical protein
LNHPEAFIHKASSLKYDLHWSVAEHLGGRYKRRFGTRKASTGLARGCAASFVFQEKTARFGPAEAVPSLQSGQQGSLPGHEDAEKWCREPCSLSCASNKSLNSVRCLDVVFHRSIIAAF